MHLKVIPMWPHLSALCNVLWQMSNYRTATPWGNYPQAAFSPGYRHKEEASWREWWEQTSWGPLLRWCVGWYVVSWVPTLCLQHGFNGRSIWVDASHPVVKGRFLLKRRRNCTCPGFIQRLKIPTTCSLLAPTCLYSCDRWVMAAQPRNMRQKCQVSHAPGLGRVLYAFGSQAREDSEHAKFKVNSRDEQGHLLLLGTALQFLPVCPHSSQPAPYRMKTSLCNSHHRTYLQTWDRTRKRRASVCLLLKDLVAKEGENTHNLQQSQ